MQGNKGVFDMKFIDSRSIHGLPEYVTYKGLKKAIKETMGFTLPNVADLMFEKGPFSRKSYAYIEKFI